MNCKRCQQTCIKNGFQANGKQRYYCTLCKFSQQETYTYRAYQASTNQNIYKLLVNSCGFNDVSRILGISRQTVNRRLMDMTKSIKRPALNETLQTYEIDEMHIKVQGMGDYCYLAYAMNRSTKGVISFCVGSRNTLQLSKIVHPVLLLNPKRIYTEKLSPYQKLIPKNIHGIGKSLTNCIERYHLTLRTHLKSLSRKTICYCKSLKTIKGLLSLYFWGHTIKFVP